MFGLNEAMFNAVKKQARNLSAIYSNLSKDERMDNKFVADLISDMWNPVSTVISRDKFVWVAGYIKGRVGHDENGNSLYE